jgi:hypothetical protein
LSNFLEKSVYIARATDAFCASPSWTVTVYPHPTGRVCRADVEGSVRDMPGCRATSSYKTASVNVDCRSKHHHRHHQLRPRLQHASQRIVPVRKSPGQRQGRRAATQARGLPMHVCSPHFLTRRLWCWL